MADIVVNVQRREQTGKNESRRLRQQGLVPAILYGDNKPPVSVAVEARALQLLLHSEKGMNTIFDLALTGTDQRRSARILDYQVDPISARLVHADFVRVVANVEIHVDVHVELVGVPAGVKLGGGVLDHSLREVEVACLPKDIPSALQVDVTGLQVGQLLRVSDIPLPAGVRVLSEGQLVICSVHVPKEEAAAAKTTEAAVTPEAAAAAAKAAPAAGAKAGEGDKGKDAKAKDPKAKEPKAK